jgi:hypothetical protein
MNLKQNLLDLLANLPEVDTVDKRKAFLGFVGFSYLGIYLNWEGSTVVFSSRLVDELSGRGQSIMLQFLDNLPGAPQVGHDRKAKVADLVGTVKALDQASWESEFGAPIEALPIDRAPDLDMLALTVVSTVLVPHFRDAGAAGRQAAYRLVERLEQALANDPAAFALWEPFKKSPEALEQFVMPKVKALLEQNQELSQDLALLTAVAIKEMTEHKPGEIDVTQRIRLIQGNVLGAAIGMDVINGITAKVTQDVDTVAAGGNLVGLRLDELGFDRE